MNSIKALERKALGDLAEAIEAGDKLRARTLSTILRDESLEKLASAVAGVAERLLKYDVGHSFDVWKFARNIAHELTATSDRLRAVVEEIAPYPTRESAPMIPAPPPRPEPPPGRTLKEGQLPSRKEDR